MKAAKSAIIIVLVLAGIFIAYNQVFFPADDISVPVQETSKKTNSKESAENLDQEKKLWGAYAGNTASSVSNFEQMVGDRPDMLAYFVGWYELFPINFALPLKSKNQTLLIFWEQYNVTLDEIISGRTDNYIKQFAKDVRAYSNPVVIAPFHEMNGEWSPWSGVSGDNTPEKLVLAWRHAYDVFNAVENPNVKWAWVVNYESVPDTPNNAIENYYPGNEYVDYVGVDGFNFGEPWMSYDEIFSSVLKGLRRYNKPVYIFSMACVEGPKKAGWIKDALFKIRTDPNLDGFVWFNTNKEKNWLVNSDTDSLQAFVQGVK